MDQRPGTTSDELVREIVEADYNGTKCDSFVQLAKFKFYEQHE